MSRKVLYEQQIIQYFVCVCSYVSMHVGFSPVYMLFDVWILDFVSICVGTGTLIANPCLPLILLCLCARHLNSKPMLQCFGLIMGRLVWINNISVL